MKIVLHTWTGAAENKKRQASTTLSYIEKMEAHVAKCYVDKMNEFLAGELDDDQAAKWITPYQLIDIIHNLREQNIELRAALEELNETK